MKKKKETKIINAHIEPGLYTQFRMRLIKDGYTFSGWLRERINHYLKLSSK